MTNVEYIWTTGDVMAHSEQVTIAMGKVHRLRFGFIKV